MFFLEGFSQMSFLIIVSAALAIMDSTSLVAPLATAWDLSAPGEKHLVILLPRSSCSLFEFVYLAWS